MQRLSMIRAGLLLACLAVPGFADSRYIVRLWNASNIDKVCKEHGVYVVRKLQGSGEGLFVVAVPDGPASGSTVQLMAADAEIGAIEADTPVVLPELSGAPVVTQPGLPPVFSPNQNTLFFGTQVWDPYVNQPAVWNIGAPLSELFATGSGTVVAVIDTGVDPNNLVLEPVLTGGYDFIRNVAGGSEMADVSQSTTEVLDQSTTEVLDFASAVVLTLNQSTTEVLDQSTTEVLDQSTTEVLDTNPPPPAFGHGTMTAGLVHLVAPQAQLMPLKAFDGTGTASLSAVVAAIYYAVDNGADVISMSFSATQSSPTLQAALQFAISNKVVPVAAVGNAGVQTSQVYPAAYSSVVGVASVNNLDQRSSFSNYGSVVMLAAPGEGVISTYPGTNNYAAGWGTSFSTPLVAGGAALLVQLKPNRGVGAVEAALQNGSVNVGQGLGAGVLNLPGSLWYADGHQ